MDKNIISEIKDVIALEIKVLNDLLDSIDEQFEKAVGLILESKGKIVLSGMGKSGLIARKIASTLSSTGTVAMYLHPSEALHGDIGAVEKGDTLIILGKSGESDEIVGMLPVLKMNHCKIISITANKESTLARHSDIILHTPVEKEACALNLAPTCSTTAALVVGDALAIALMKKKNFSRQDFAMSHPAGRLGKRLLYKVNDLMKTGDENPVVHLDELFDVVVSTITKGLVNAVSVVDKKNNFKGLITSYHLRQALQSNQDIRKIKAKEMMFDDPTTIEQDAYAVEAFKLMKKSPMPLLVLPVLKGKQAVGIITMQDMIKEGL